MKINNYLDRYLLDTDYKIIFKDNKVNINNYTEIMDFNSREVTIKHDASITRIKGKDLVVSRMEDNEILITGSIKEIDP